MATTKYYNCSKCGQTNVPYLLDALLHFADSGEPKCKTCNGPLQLHLGFPYGLGAGTWTYNVVAVFHPCPPTTTDGSKVTFYPFLVVMKSITPRPGERGFWLPYWHTVESGATMKRQFGQWAPQLNVREFKSMFEQAHDYLPM